MKELPDLPAERDLPPARMARMRADLVRAIGRPRGWSMQLRLAATAVAVVVIAGVLLAMPGNEDGEHLLAMGTAELSPTLRHAAEQCLEWNEEPTVDEDGNVVYEPVPAFLSDLAVATQQNHRTTMLFLTDPGYLTCDMSTRPGEELSGGLARAREWQHGDLLPGPVHRLLQTSSEIDGGDVAVSGRVSVRVHQLVLEHGNGNTTTARLAGGVFGLLSEGADVEADAELVSYDASGQEIDRQPLFQAQPLDQYNPDRCYTDRSGAVIYGQPGPDCRPAERWGRG